MSNIIQITDFLDPALDVYARLTENQLVNRDNPGEGLFIAESPKVIHRALDAGCVPVSFLVDGKEMYGDAAPVLARCPDTPIYTAPFEVLTQLTGFKLTRGLLCAMRRPGFAPLENLLAGKRRIAVLDSVMNPTNVGAIIRSAAALNMDAVLLTPGCSDPLYRRAIRVSMGTVFQVPWAWLPENWLDCLHGLGYKIAAMALKEDTLSIRDPRLQDVEKLAIVLGTEGEGLADATIDGCDFTVKIPMSHGVDSLNVAAASAVAFFQLGGGE